jgi:hypothetical protein
MTTHARIHHRPSPRTAYLRGKPASVWVDAIARDRAGRPVNHEDRDDVG